MHPKELQDLQNEFVALKSVSGSVRGSPTEMMIEKKGGC
jgi:hypothetical protein